MTPITRVQEGTQIDLSPPNTKYENSPEPVSQLFRARVRTVIMNEDRNVCYTCYHQDQEDSPRVELDTQLPVDPP